MKQRIFNLVIAIAVLSLGIFQYLNYPIRDTPKVLVITLKEPVFLKSDNPKEDLIKVLNYYGVKHPEIVYAQAILETGHFKSRIFRDYNNLFGLYNSATKDYYKFNHWSESVLAYMNYVQYKYKGDDSKPPNDYYKFLEDLGYAEDKQYIQKVKRIVKQNDERRNK